MRWMVWARWLRYKGSSRRQGGSKLVHELDHGGCLVSGQRLKGCSFAGGPQDDEAVRGPGDEREGGAGGTGPKGGCVGCAWVEPSPSCHIIVVSPLHCLAAGSPPARAARRSISWTKPAPAAGSRRSASRLTGWRGWSSLRTRWRKCWGSGRGFRLMRCWMRNSWRFEGAILRYLSEVQVSSSQGWLSFRVRAFLVRKHRQPKKQTRYVIAEELASRFVKPA